MDRDGLPGAQRCNTGGIARIGNEAARPTPRPHTRKATWNTLLAASLAPRPPRLAPARLQIAPAWWKLPPCAAAPRRNPFAPAPTHPVRLCQSGAGRLCKTRAQPLGGPAIGTDCARIRRRLARPRQRPAVRTPVRHRHARAGRRSPRLVQPSAALGQLRHAGARLAQRAHPGRGVAPLVPPPWFADHRRHAAADHPLRRARMGRSAHHRTACTRPGARIRPDIAAAQCARPGLLVGGFTHRAAGG